MEKKFSYTSEELKSLLNGFAHKIGLSIGNNLGGLIGQELAKIEATKILDEILNENDSSNSGIGNGEGRCRPGGSGGGGVESGEGSGRCPGSGGMKESEGSGRCPGGSISQSVMDEANQKNNSSEDISDNSSRLSPSEPQILSVKKVGKKSN